MYEMLLSLSIYTFLILQEEKLEAEEFTEKLYRELKSTPQPCLVPFLKVTGDSTVLIIIVSSLGVCKSSKIYKSDFQLKTVDFRL